MNSSTFGFIALKFFIVICNIAFFISALTIKKRKRRLSPTLSGSPQAEYTMVKSAPL